MSEPSVVINSKGWRWHRTGHPWVFSGDISRADPSLSGEVVSVVSERGRFLGRAFYNARSKIGLRFITRGDEAIDAAFWRRRLEKAILYRKSLEIDSDAVRIVFSEADGMPGLIADSYAGSLVVQTLCLGMDRIRSGIIDLLAGLLEPSSVLLRNDAAVRELEGLPRERCVAAGEAPKEVRVREGTREYIVDIWEGHKTGAYLDQRDNRLRLRGLSRGRVLDAFSYQGHFSLQLAAGADEVIAVESSSPAVEMLEKNLALNSIGNVDARRANAFDLLREFSRKGERFDIIVLDPPPFARRRTKREDALRGYREINVRAMRCLTPGGILFTCCCSHAVGAEEYLGMLGRAAGDAGRRVFLLETCSQSLDHPVLLSAPESGYLKCFLLRAED